MAPKTPIVSTTTKNTAPSYAIRRRGGGSLIQQCPVFSPDQTSLFVISGSNIQIYDVATAELVKTLKNDESSSPIISMGFPTQDDRTLITCNKAGKIINWKWHASVQYSEKDIKIPKNAYVQTFNLLNDTEAVVSWCTLTHINICIVNLNSGDTVRKPFDSRMTLPHNWSIAIGNYGNYFPVAFSTGSSVTRVFNSQNPKDHYNRKIRKLYVTTLAWHTTSEILAIGDSSGCINLCYNPSQTTSFTQEILHWHHLPLKAIAFSLQGGLMLSGGHERVLVAWGANNSKQFIPRLPATILHISASKTHLALSTADNSIQIVENSSLRVTGCIREAGGLGGVSYKKNENVKSPAIQYIRSSSALMLPASSGHLHLYSTISDSLMYTMDVTNTNIVHPEKDNLNPEQTEVTGISVGCRGQWLVTWEGVDEQERLRWWEWSGHNWKLHTVVARPHRPALPYDVYLAADTPVTLTTDQQNNIRIWKITDTVPGYEGKSAWYTNARCYGSGGNTGGGTLSGDGSVAAVWFGARLTLWDTLEGKQKTSLAHPALRPQGKLVQFGREHHMHYIACTTDTCLAVWNTMTLRLIWMVKLDTSCLISDPFSDKVVAVTKTNDVFIFRMPDPKPLITLNEILPIDQGAITSITFAPLQSSIDGCKLYLLREQQEIFVIEPTDCVPKLETTLERINESSKPLPSAYSAMIAEKEANLVVRQNTQPAQFGTKAPVNDILLSSSAHAQPRLSNLCSLFLKSLVDINVSNTSMLNSENIKEEIVTVEESTAKPKKLKTKKILAESFDWAIHLIDEDGDNH